MSTTTARTDVYTRVTNHIVEELERGVRPWLKVLKGDKRAVFSAASHASQAVDILHGLQPQSAS